MAAGTESADELKLRELTRQAGFTANIAERDAMRVACTMMWTITWAAIFVISLTNPELGPDNLLAFQVGYIAIVVVCVVSQFTWMSKLSDTALLRVESIWNLVSVAMSLGLMLSNPLTLSALFISLIVPATFAAQFLAARMVVFQTTVITIVSIVPLAVHSGDLAEQHVVSRIAAFLPILWVVVAAVWTLRRNRENAIAAAQLASTNRSSDRVAEPPCFQQARRRSA